MDDYTHKSLITAPYNLTYSYYTSPSFSSITKSRPDIPVVMLLHGFPDHAYMWAGVVPHLQKLGYPLLLPDILGFGGSSKPTDYNMYNYRIQANSLCQILDKEGITESTHKVIPIGHDWGSATAQRFYLFHPDRCAGLAIMSLAYQIPSPEPMDMVAANKDTEKIFGYPQWEYWNFFTAEDSPELMRRNLERFWEVNNGLFVSDKPGEEGRDIWMREMFCKPNAMREYITQTGAYKDFTVKMKPYPNEAKQRQDFVERLSRDGLEGPVCYYHSLKNNAAIDDEKWLCQKNEKGKDRRLIEKPMLYVGQTGDWVCRTDLMKDAKEKNLVPDLEERAIEAGHWCCYECPDKVAEPFATWLSKRFPVKS